MTERNRYTLSTPRSMFAFTRSSMVSNNDMYFHVPYKRKGSNRTTTHAVKSGELKGLQEELTPKLQFYITDEFANKCVKYLETKLYSLSITTDYFIPLSNYESSDVSNYVKAYEDCISSRLKKVNKILDDKNNTEHHLRKILNTKDEWRIETIIKIVPRDPYYREYIIGEHCEEVTNVSILSQDSKCCVCNSPITLEENDLICKNCGAYYRRI